MNKNRLTRVIALAALVATPFASVLASGPFQVRRATAPQDVAAAPPVATISTSPYDGDAVPPPSGTSSFYKVYDASGNALVISLQTNPVTHAIRIGFDDGNPASAAVDANASSLAVGPATIRADGLQAASIAIAPRDANGVLLGRGLSVAIDAAVLWPAQLTGPIADLGDGTYLALAVASVPGMGSVRVVVESVELAPLPTITATPLDPSGSLRDLAIAELQGQTGAGGPFATLVAAAGSGTPQANSLAAANGRARAALAALAADDFGRDDNVLKTDFDAVLSQMEGVLASPGALDPQDVRAAMDGLLGIARLIAQWHIERAEGACGVCDGSGNPAKVCDAIAALAVADAMRAAVSPDWGGTADEYAWAVERALQAMTGC